MLRKLLIVDDNDMNRELLREMLENDYEILEAENGVRALELIERNEDELSAVLLDLVMSVMNGYEVLAHIQEQEAWQQIPVLVTTGSVESASEVKALNMGANDYITKPYNIEIIRHRLKNIIELREKAAIVNATRVDALTGILSRSAFLELVKELVLQKEPGYYVMSCFDIENFKVINDQYGTKKGDEVLKLMAQIVQDGFAEYGGVCCRIMADNYAVLYPRSFMDSVEIDAIRKRTEMLDGSLVPITLSIGRYIVENITLSPSAMYDRASIAKESIKGRFDRHIAIFDESMRKRILNTQKMISEMVPALEAHQFEVWFQPQYNHVTGSLVGAEALVRWRHPQQGLIPPNLFIPLFEQNGFIYEVDKYVWEQTCICLKEWREEKNLNIPASVNISRYDLVRDDLVEVILGLVSKYEIPIELLHLEITETAFANTSNQILDVARRLRAAGFLLEIDDFGSGYSSLNTLKDVPADVIKLDMRFLDEEGNSGRGGNILESVVKMAKWLGMVIIAEGVEQVEQPEFLKSIGCNYMQGYLYAKPMPKQEYEELVSKSTCEKKKLALRTIENLDTDAFWDPKSMDTLIFNSYVGGACIFEYYNGNIELIRANDKYAQVIGSAGMTIEDALKLNWSEHLDLENQQAVQQAVQKSIESGDEVIGEFVFNDLPGCPGKTHLRSLLRVIATTGERCLIYCTNENITMEKRAEEERCINEAKTRQRYEYEMQLRHELIKDSIVYYQLNLTNGMIDEYLSMYEDIPSMKIAIPIGEQMRQDILHNVAPEDRDRVRDTIFSQVLLEAYKSGKTSINLEYRRYLGEKGLCWVRTSIALMKRPDTEEIIAFLYVRDIDMEKKDQLAIKTIMDEEIEVIIVLEVKHKRAHLVHARENPFKIPVGKEFNFDKKFAALLKEMVLEDDQEESTKFFRTASLKKRLQKEKISAVTYRIKEQGVIHRKMSKAYYLDSTQKEIVLIRRDITDLYEEEQRQKTELQKAVYDANKANHAKSDFLSNMSHDMRTPLNAVLAFSNEKIIDMASEQQLREYLDKIHVSGDYLLGIINDVLDMSKIEQNKIVLNPEPYEFREFVKTIKNVIGELCRNKDINFKIDASNADLYVVMVDRVRFNQIFVNLLSNAVKFTPEGGTVELIVENCQNVNEQKTVKRFIVRDNGIGMSKEFLPHAFESFKQEFRKDVPVRSQGTGLGLAIVKKLVSLMDGTIAVESEYGKGTTFTLDLPFEIVSNKESIAEDKKVNVHSIKGMHILVAEDNVMNTEIVVTLLEMQGCQVDCTEDGEQAVQKFEQSEEGYYDVILMDLRMPIMNGLEASKVIRAMKRSDAKTIPIIALTADAFDEDKLIARGAGMNDLLSKPIEPNLLYSMLESKQTI